jgi:hypothetical protein
MLRRGGQRKTSVLWLAGYDQLRTANSHDSIELQYYGQLHSHDLAVPRSYIHLALKPQAVNISVSFDAVQQPLVRCRLKIAELLLLMVGFRNGRMAVENSLLVYKTLFH